jgi:hypothetical protein
MEKGDNTKQNPTFVSVGSVGGGRGGFVLDAAKDKTSCFHGKNNLFCSAI